MGKVKKYSYAAFFFLGLFIGGLTGVILINALISYRIDNYIKEIESLKTIIVDKNVKVQKLEDSIMKKRFIVKEINLELNFNNAEENDDITKIALQKHIKEKFKGLIGKDVDKVDGEIVSEIIHRRIMKLHGKEYQLSVDRILISQEIKLWITIKVIKN